MEEGKEGEKRKKCKGRKEEISHNVNLLFVVLSLTHFHLRHVQHFLTFTSLAFITSLYYYPLSSSSSSSFSVFISSSSSSSPVLAFYVSSLMNPCLSSQSLLFSCLPHLFLPISFPTNVPSVRLKLLSLQVFLFFFFSYTFFFLVVVFLVFLQFTRSLIH